MRVGEGERPESYESPVGALQRRKIDFIAPVEPPDQDQTIDLRAYWLAILKRRWTVLTILFVTFTFVLIWTLKQERVYRSETLIEIGNNREIANLKDMAPAESGQTPTELETQFQILQSKTLARRVIDDLRLDRNPDFNPAYQKGRSANPQSLPYEAMVKSFLDRLDVKPLKGSRLVWVGYEYKDPDLTARIVNSLAKNYMEQNLEANWQASQVASEWLQQKLNETRIGLEKAEESLQEYARENGLFFLVSKPDQPEELVAENLQRLQEELGKAQTERFKAQWLGQLSQKNIYTATSVPGIFENAITQNLESKITELKAKRAEMLATFNPEYPKLKDLQFQIDELENYLVEERKRVAQSTAQSYNAIVARENLLRKAFTDEQTRATATAEQAVHYNILKREVDTNRELYNGLLQRLKEMGVTASMKANTIRVVDAAEAVRIPVRPNIKLNLLMGMVLGLGLGIGAALLQEVLDNTIKSPDDIERSLRLPLLALIPMAEPSDPAPGTRPGLKAPEESMEEVEESLPAPSQQSWYRIDAMEKKHSPLAEAFRSLRTSVLLSAADRPPRSLLVCSGQPSEGKTTVAVNLAISLAQLGERVLLIDCDLRRPSVHRALGIKDRMGLVHYLIGRAEWKSLVQPTGIPGIDVLVSGPVPPNPAELLSSERMRHLIPQVMETYNFVMIDSPPVLTVSDSRVLMPLVDAVILVVAGGVTPRHVAQRAYQHAREVGANMVGVVLNKADVSTHGYYGYYSYYYSDESHASLEEDVSPKV